MKRALSLLHNNKSKNPDAIKNEFLKYGGEAIGILLKDYFQQIPQSEDIPTQWNSSALINIDKGRQDKEKLDNKRGYIINQQYSKTICKNYHQKIIIKLNNHLQLMEAQAGAQPGKNTLTNLLALKSVIQQRMTKIKKYMLLLST